MQASSRIRPRRRTRNPGIPPPDAGTAATVDALAAALVGDGTLAALLERALEAIIALAGARAGAIRLMSPDGAHLQFVTTSGLPAEMLRKESFVDAKCGSCGRALRDDDMQSVGDLAVCHRQRPCSFFEHDMGSMIVVPVHCEGRPIGVLNLFFARDGAAPRDVSRLLLPVGQLLDIALENAKLTRESFRMSMIAERQMIAAEVHDSLGQNLAYMRMRMSLLQDAIRAHDELRAFKYWSDVNASLGETHSRLRELIAQFRETMDPQGLVHALEAIAADFFDKTGIFLELENAVPDLDLPVDREVQVFHIVREALANVVKHAGAQRVRVALERTRDGIEIRVEDDGVGVPETVGLAAEATGGPLQPGGTAAVLDAARADEGHFGLRIMRERAQRIGARLDVASSAGAGTRIRLLLPESAGAQRGSRR